MSDHDAVLRRLEIFLNEQRADLANFEVILQTLLLNMGGAGPQGRARIADLKEQVLAHIRNAKPAAQGEKEHRRVTELRAIRCEHFFQVIEEALPPAGSTGGPKGAN